MNDNEKAPSVLRSCVNVFNKVAKYTTASLAAAFTVAALTVSSVYTFGNDLNVGTESFRDYGERIEMPKDIMADVPNTDVIRVYDEGVSGYLYKVGQYTNWEVHSAISDADYDAKVEAQDKDATAGILTRAGIWITTGIPSFIKNSVTVKDQHFSEHPLNAYALTLPNEAVCHINAPKRIEDMADFAYLMTGIYPGYMTQYQGVETIDLRTPVMLHEASHCNNYPDARSLHDLYSPVYTLKGEASADSEMYATLNKHFNDTSFSDYWYHVRAVSALSKPWSFGASHSTSPIAKSPLNDGKEFSEEDIYAAYVHLNVLIKDMQADIHPYFGFFPSTGQDIYFLDTYVKVYQILNSGKFDITDAARRAGELYLDGVQYLVPDVKNIDHSKIPLDIERKVAPKEPESLVDKGLKVLGLS
ncbi:MAG: hypothetical protein CL561_05425 [Alphaproteobacteria bacterium]|nr:hypothetical protein [Alphaproteobacteria bacterium]|tara:strand:+ start:7848 stop:9095 length:1248 start_codon:yes stop_codon:yes gene_type:complete